MARSDRSRAVMSGIVLIAIGSLVLVPGLGATAFGTAALTDLLDEHNVHDAEFVIAAALVAGLPFLAIGGGLAWAGIRALRHE